MNPASNNLTPWVPTRKQPPPFIGWWKTRRESCPGMLQPQRRWWNGHHWSIPVEQDYEDDQAEMCRQLKSDYQEIEWCGLKMKPHSLYSYDITETPRAQLLHKVSQHDAS